MSDDRLFSDEELKTLGQRTLDLLEDALDKGENENAKKLARRMYGEFLGMHDLYRDWVTHLLTFIGERDGDDVLGRDMSEKRPSGIACRVLLLTVLMDIAPSGTIIS